MVLSPFGEQDRRNYLKLLASEQKEKKKHYLSGSEQYGNKGRHDYKSFTVAFSVSALQFPRVFYFCLCLFIQCDFPSFLQTEPSENPFRLRNSSCHVP